MIIYIYKSRMYTYYTIVRNMRKRMFFYYEKKVNKKNDKSQYIMIEFFKNRTNINSLTYINIVVWLLFVVVLVILINKEKKNCY